jgi:peptidoglycan/xylan/chitin deacetylase (PgdA/CDA1 family)
VSRVTLSFDNGPDPRVTPGVLEVLARRGVRASFFVLGRALADPRCRAIAERAHAEGHWIGNHTFSHRVPFGVNPAAGAAESEVGATQRLIGRLAHPDRPFRPFGAGGRLDRRLLSRALVDYLVRGGYSCVLWNAVPRDWEQPEGWVATALAQVAALDWALLVVHDVLPGNAREVERLLDGLERAGHELVQAFPPDCVPIRRGAVVGSLDAYQPAARPSAEESPDR